MIEIHQGGILDFDGDCIVNPANSFLHHGAGLAKVIADAATPVPPRNVSAQTGRQTNVAEIARAYRCKAEWWSEQRDHPLIPTGGAGWTSSGALPYKGIVHAVGPIWAGGGLFEEDLLDAAHRSAMRVAAKHDCTSIAFPAISCGIFGYPVHRAAEIAIERARFTGQFFGFKRIAFYLFEDEHFRAYLAAESKGSL